MTEILIFLVERLIILKLFMFSCTALHTYVCTEEKQYNSLTATLICNNSNICHDVSMTWKACKQCKFNYETPLFLFS